MKDTPRRGTSGSPAPFIMIIGPFRQTLRLSSRESRPRSAACKKTGTSSLAASARQSHRNRRTTFPRPFSFCSIQKQGMSAGSVFLFYCHEFKQGSRTGFSIPVISSPIRKGRHNRQFFPLFDMDFTAIFPAASTERILSPPVEPVNSACLVAYMQQKLSEEFLPLRASDHPPAFFDKNRRERGLLNRLPYKKGCGRDFVPSSFYGLRYSSVPLFRKPGPRPVSVPG